MAPPGLHHLSNFPSGMHDLGPCESGGPGWPMATSSMVAEDQDLLPSRPALALKTLPIALHAPHLRTKTLAAGNSQRTPGMWTPNNKTSGTRQAPTERPRMFLNPLQADRKTRPPTRPIQHHETPARPPCNPEQPRPRTSPPTHRREPPAQCHRTALLPMPYVPARLPSGRSLLRQKQRTQLSSRSRFAPRAWPLHRTFLRQVRSRPAYRDSTPLSSAGLSL